MGGLSFRVIDEREKTAEFAENPFPRGPASVPGQRLRIVFADFIDHLHLMISARIDARFDYGKSAAGFAHIFHQPDWMLQIIQDLIAVYDAECSQRQQRI